MAKMLSGSKYDYREYVHSEFLRICWNFVTADLETCTSLHFYYALFNPNNDNPFPPFTEWRKQRAMEIEIRKGKGVKDYSSEVHATFEAKRYFHKYILTPMEDFQKEQALPFMERILGNVPGVWDTMYEQRREHELRNYKESFKRDTLSSPYPKLKIERELKWWSWVLFPEQVDNPPRKFVKRFESDASLQETRKFAEIIIEGVAKFEQIGALEGVGWRKYAMADARIQYREWLVENRGNERIWEDDISNSVEGSEIIRQQLNPLPTNAEEYSEHDLQGTEFTYDTSERTAKDLQSVFEAEVLADSQEGKGQIVVGGSLEKKPTTKEPESAHVKPDISKYVPEGCPQLSFRQAAYLIAYNKGSFGDHRSDNGEMKDLAKALCQRTSATSGGGLHNRYDEVRSPAKRRELFKKTAANCEHEGKPPRKVKEIIGSIETVLPFVLDEYKPEAEKDLHQWKELHSKWAQ